MPLFCGVSTGLVAAFYCARVKPGGSATIFRLGGVGLSAPMGCVISGVKKIYAIDMLDKKLNFTCQFEATHTINSLKESPLEKITSDIEGIDYVFECVVNTSTMTLAYEFTATNGTVVIIGYVPPGQMLTIDPLSFLIGQKIVAGCGGNSGTIGDITKFIGLHMASKLLLDDIVGKTFKLEEVYEA